MRKVFRLLEIVCISIIAVPITIAVIFFSIVAAAGLLIALKFKEYVEDKSRVVKENYRVKKNMAK